MSYYLPITFTRNLSQYIGSADLLRVAVSYSPQHVVSFEDKLLVSYYLEFEDSESKDSFAGIQIRMPSNNVLQRLSRQFLQHEDYRQRPSNKLWLKRKSSGEVCSGCSAFEFMVEKNVSRAQRTGFFAAVLDSCRIKTV